MAQAKEIERKWLISKNDIPFDLETLPKIKMEQSYISFSPTIRIRSMNQSKFILCVKSKAKEGSLSRDEFETEITKEQYEFLLGKIEGNIIEKTRYIKYDETGHKMEIDIFSNALEGLAYMEIEFQSEEEALLYRTPSWAIADVSFDSRYNNTALAQLGMPPLPGDLSDC